MTTDKLMSDQEKYQMALDNYYANAAIVNRESFGKVWNSKPWWMASEQDYFEFLDRYLKETKSGK